MVKKYIKLYIKRNIILALIISTIIFIPFFIVSLLYDVLAYDLVISFVPFVVAFICVLIGLLPIFRFIKMIALQESLYNTIFSDTDVIHLETTLYLSKDWLIWAGSCAIYKKHIKSITYNMQIGSSGASNRVKLTTVDDKHYVIWCLSKKNVKKIKMWINT